MLTLVLFKHFQLKFSLFLLRFSTRNIHSSVFAGNAFSPECFVFVCPAATPHEPGHPRGLGQEPCQGFGGQKLRGGGLQPFKERLCGIL